MTKPTICGICGTQVFTHGNNCAFYSASIGYQHERCPPREREDIAVPPAVPVNITLEDWLLTMFPGANLDKLEINARLAIQMAHQYAEHLLVTARLEAKS